MTDEPEPAGSRWDDVGDSFDALGRLLQDRLKTTDRGDGDTGAIEDALRTLGDAVAEVGERVTATARDPELRRLARRSADSFVAALSASLGSAADEVGGVLRGRRRARSDEEVWMAATDDVDSDDKDLPAKREED